MDRKERIINLQIKNSRKRLCEKINTKIKEIDLSDFIPLNSTIELQKKFLYYMKCMDEKKLSIKESLDISYVELVKQNLDVFSEYFQQKVVFFHRQSMDIGAIEIDVGLLLKNIDYILSISDMYEYGCNVLFINKDMKFGLCIWKSEYDFSLYKWDRIV